MPRMKTTQVEISASRLYFQNRAIGIGYIYSWHAQLWRAQLFGYVAMIILCRYMQIYKMIRLYMSNQFISITHTVCIGKMMCLNLLAKGVFCIIVLSALGLGKMTEHVNLLTNAATN